MVGYKDQSGKVVIKAQFDDAETFSQGIARVYNKTKGANAYIDTTGKLVIPYQYGGENPLNDAYGYANVYIYFGDECYKVS